MKQPLCERRSCMAVLGVKKVEIPDEIKIYLKQQKTKKVLATKDKDGNIHAVFKGSIDIDKDGNITLLEILESSQTNKNLTFSLWFKERVSIVFCAEDGTSYQIKGYPYKAISLGPDFEKKYTELIEKNSDLDLSGIWVIIPDEIRKETFAERLWEEREKYPILGHADRDFLG